MSNFRVEFERTERSLKESPANIKDKFINAVMEGVFHLLTNSQELDKMPENLRKSFLKFMDKAGCTTNVDGQAQFQAKIKGLSSIEVQVLADEFMKLNNEVNLLPQEDNLL